jgi:hypothetical protein
MDYDSNSNNAVRVGFVAAGITGVAVAGEIIDTLNFGSVDFVVQSAAITAGTFSATIAESDDDAMSGAVAVSGQELLGSVNFGATGVTGTNGPNSAEHIGSVGKRRYQQLTITAPGSTAGSAIAVSASAVLSHARENPPS